MGESHELYVLTGGPCTGKTSVGRELAGMGYDVLPEAARAVIQEELPKGQPILPWTDLAAFQSKVLAKQLDLESRVNGTPTFLDRSIIDNIAYCRVGGVPVPSDVARKTDEYTRNGHYRTVFLLDPVPYTTDAERREDPQLASRIHEAIGQVYRERGYDIVRVPVMETPAHRARYIASRIAARAGPSRKADISEADLSYVPGYPTRGRRDAGDLSYIAGQSDLPGESAMMAFAKNSVTGYRWRPHCRDDRGWSERMLPVRRYS